MRFSAIYVDSMRKWAVIDTLSDNFELEVFDNERDARRAARSEENRWAELFGDELPATG
jgi:3-methyladenine DNA glycosylase AlkD